MRERRDKGNLKVEQEFQRYINTRLYIAPYPFSTKNVISELIEKLENVLRSESKSTAVYRKEIELNNKGRSASAILLYRRYINYPQKWKGLYLSID